MTDMEKEIEEAAVNDALEVLGTDVGQEALQIYAMGYIKGANAYASKLEALKKENEEARGLLDKANKAMRKTGACDVPTVLYVPFVEEIYQEIKTYLNRKNDGK